MADDDSTDVPGNLGDLYALLAGRNPSLDELKAGSDMVTGPDGALMPKVLADRGQRGWDGADGAPADRDSGEAAKLAGLVRDMDGFADEVIFNDLDGMARVLADQWQAIRKITQGRG
jgi:hypothetical protein